MPGEINIGGPTSKSTWASLRSPAWSGTGYKDKYPDTRNWGKTTIPNAAGGGFAGNFYRNRKYFNYGYEEPLTPLMRAMASYPGSDEGSFVFQIGSMSMGIYRKTEQYPVTYVYVGGGEYAPNPEYDPTPPIMSYWLRMGEALHRRPEYFGNDPYNEEDVFPAYGWYGLRAGPFAGYDYNSTRQLLLGAVANVTFPPGPIGAGLGMITTDVTITEDMFPIKPDNERPLGDGFQPSLGVQIGTYEWPSFPESNWPYGYSDNSWDPAGYKINSITLPS